MVIGPWSNAIALLPDLSINSYLLLMTAAFLIGVSKSGLKGLGSIVVTLFALAIDVKTSTGAIVPLLIVADVLAVSSYRKTVQWKHLGYLMPFMLLGLIIGVIVGDSIDPLTFKYMLAMIIIVSAVVMLILDRVDKEYVPRSRWFSSFMGLGAGFTTMVGNLAGAFANVYFLALRFPKMEFIATAAWMFFIINIIKLPFHIFLWKTIKLPMFYVDLMLIPFVVIGFYAGYRIVKLIDNELFRRYIIWATMLGGVMILFK